MIGEEIKDTLKELTIEELRNITWAYADESIPGLYEDNIVRTFLWQVVECGDIHSLSIVRCNVAEGWIEHFDTSEGLKTKVECKIKVELLTATGEVFLTLE